MKYILDQSELDGLAPKIELIQANAAMELLRRMIVSNEQCQKTRRMYCDKCPLSRPMNHGHGREMSKLMCDRNQEYSK